ncbi:protein FAM83F [Corythoichthys intestinalis]|uniref:protein FAM83F n=1 Tax=Corythoichthys intestinalis TaxID=161448 RepID=UPI0025A5C6F0|nr:protein FAM83F [Corythoichthys intestinalis]
MPGSQEASLDENAVILPVKPSSPEFLYSERERQSVEKLLCEGPKAFYNSVGAGLFGSFLSPDEVGEITSWVKDFHFTPLQKKENGGTADPHEEDLTSSYFPSYSDAPVPGLELGWPEAPWVRMENVSVYTNPPAEGGPPIREVIRRHLQKASQVLGIVTDRLTDSTIIGDLHGAASRGVPVYIILNQRTSEEKYTFQRLGHPNIRVRLLGGKSFCSRKGKMMVGELKDKFILVDLVTVIHGNYSLTWTDAHLHRHIISVINGSAVDSFDKEFRMLFAASAPVPNLWEYAVPHVDMTKARNDFTDPSPPRHFHIKHEILNPPSPPMDTNLDWEAMGVIPRGTYPDSLEEGGIVASETAFQTNMGFQKQAPALDTFTQNGYETITTRRLQNSFPKTNNMLDNAKKSNYADHQEDQATTSNHFFKGRGNNTEDRQYSAWRDKKDSNLKQNPLFSSARETRRVKPDPNLDDISTTIENKAASRKPLILKVPQSESFSSLSDLMKRFTTKQNKVDLFSRGSRNSMTDITQSMMDLREDAPDAGRAPDERRFSMSRINDKSYDQDQMTPGLILMKRRNDVVSSALQRIPKTFLPGDRLRSSGLDLNWKPLKESKEEGDK